MFRFYCGDVRYSLHYRDISLGELIPAQIIDSNPSDFLTFTGGYLTFKGDDFPYIKQYVSILILVANLLKGPGFNRQYIDLFPELTVQCLAP